LPQRLAEKLASFLLEPRPKMPNMHAALKKQKISAPLSPNSLFEQARVPPAGVRFKISGNQIIRTPASANIDPGSGGTY
jgi:hypothetical protein